MLRTKDLYMKACRQSKMLHALNDEEKLRLQAHLRKMYSDIEDICVRHNLTVMLADGSVLGAVRHGGFIPWDDDIDLNMPRKDYEDFVNIYSKELPDNYIVYAPNSKNGPISNFGKVVDKNTEMIAPGEETSTIKHGFFIDIFPLESIDPKTPFLNKWKRFCSMALVYITGSVSQYSAQSKLYKQLMSGNCISRFNYWFREILGFFFSYKSREEWQNVFDRYVRNIKETGYVHRPSDIYKWEPIPKEVFLPVKRAPFDDISAFLPNNSQFLLEYDYGDWHYIPKPEERWEHFLVSIKFEK